MGCLTKMLGQLNETGVKKRVVKGESTRLATVQSLGQSSNHQRPRFGNKVFMERIASNFTKHVCLRRLET
jgi:hypothetical protein